MGSIESFNGKMRVELVKGEIFDTILAISPTGTNGEASSRLANVDKRTDFALAHEQGQIT
jgi:hypothetical protein